VIMSGIQKARTFDRKNKKGLALNAPAPKPAAPSAGDAQIPGAIGNDVTRTDTLEIGVEFKLDLRSEDLIVQKELGAGNGGTVSKVMHAATKVIMAKKVLFLYRGIRTDLAKVQARLSTWKQKRTFESISFGSYRSCMNVPRRTL